MTTESQTTRKRIYLATPYTHKNSAMREAAHTIVNYAASVLIAHHNLHVYSPISHSHVIARDFDLQSDYEFWKEFDESEIMLSDEMYVLCEPGWQKSAGVAAEIEFAGIHDLPVKYIHRSWTHGNKFIISCVPFESWPGNKGDFRGFVDVSPTREDLAEMISDLLTWDRMDSEESADEIKDRASEMINQSKWSDPVPIIDRPVKVPMGLAGAREQLKTFVAKYETGL